VKKPDLISPALKPECAPFGGERPPPGALKVRPGNRFDLLDPLDHARALMICGQATRRKITFAEMRDMGVRGVLVYCADYRLQPLDRDQRRPLA
jgi:hypothetical protein